MRELSRKEMKQLKGGVTVGGQCQVQNTGSYDAVLFYDSAEEAKKAATNLQTHWCCASCCQASWSDKTNCALA